MKIISLTKESVSDEDLKTFLEPYDKYTTLKILSSIFTIKYADQYSLYVNWIQVIPGIVNSVLVFCNGKNTTFSNNEFEKLAVMISAYDDQMDNSVGGLSGVYKSFLRVNRHCEYSKYVQGRLEILFDMISKVPGMSFSDVANIQLEDIFLPVWGTFALGGKGQFLPLIGKNFFQDIKIPQDDIERIVKVIESSLSVDIGSAYKRALTNKNTINVSTSAFEIKPFLKLGDEYLLIAPHFVMNDLVSICASLYITKFETNPQNRASSIYGEIFEKYIQRLLSLVMPAGELEPPYGNNPNAKGVDFVFIQKHQTPLFVEIHKAVVYRSLFEDFDIEKYELFFKSRLIPKFRQTINWLKSHNLKFNDINLKEYIKSFRFVVCLSSSVPLLNFTEPSNLLLKLFNDEWEDVFGEKGSFTLFNVYVLGSFDIELLTTVTMLKKRTFVSLLYEYRQYYFKHGQLKRFCSGIEVREDITAWVQEHFNSKCFANNELLFASDKIFARFMERSFDKPVGSWKKPDQKNE